MWRGLLGVLVLILAGAVPAAAQVTVQAAGLTANDVSKCLLISQWLGYGLTPRNGTTFCPTNAALEAFAKISGYPKGFDDLMAEAKSRPTAWRAYLDRLISYHFSPDFMPAAALLSRAGAIQTGLVASRDASGEVLSATLQAFVVAKKVSLLATGSKVRVPVIGQNLYITKGAAVHAVGRVLLPPDTFPTLAAALKADKRLLTTTRLVGLNMRGVAAKAGSWVTMVAPTAAAWKSLTYVASAAKPLPGWVGNITAAAIAKDKALARALLSYSTVLPSADFVNGTVTFDQMVSIWKMAAGRSFIAMPTNLTAGANAATGKAGEQQFAMFTYDAASDAVFVLGPRNMAAQLPSGEQYYMAAGRLDRRTVYAGCATLMVVDGYVPLPQKTGLAKYDKQATTDTNNRRR